MRTLRTEHSAIEIIFELLWELVAEILMQGLGELLFELGFASTRRKESTLLNENPMLGILGALVLGALLGGLVTLLLPTRMLPAVPITGASLLISPLICGWVMHQYGHWARKHGRRVSFVASARGGASFALGFAAIRLTVLLTVAR